MISKPNQFDVVALQLCTHDRYQENLDALLGYLVQYQDKHMIVVPEVFLTGFDYLHMATAAKFSAKALKILKKEVDNQIVVLTVILADDDAFINQAVVIHKHKIVYKQSKAKLFTLGDEDLYFRTGKKKKIRPFEINGVRYALLICFELRFKTLWEQIEGVDIVLIPARWGKARKSHLEILTRALAVMNQCYVIVSNSADIEMASSSAIISPSGECQIEDTKSAIEGYIDFREIKKMRRYIVMDK